MPIHRVSLGLRKQIPASPPSMLATWALPRSCWPSYCLRCQSLEDATPASAWFPPWPPQCKGPLPTLAPPSQRDSP